MPKLIDYAEVVAQASGQGMRSLYYNSGAFGLAEGVPTYSVGWIGPADPTIRPAAQALTREVPVPYEANLAAAFRTAWMTELPGPLWVLPKSSWMYELDFGSAGWLAGALRDARVDPAALADRHDGSAIQFDLREESDVASVERLIREMLTHLMGTDFAVMFPGREVVVTIHHHKQIWWTSSDEFLISRLRDARFG